MTNFVTSAGLGSSFVIRKFVMEGSFTAWGHAFTNLSPQAITSGVVAQLTTVVAMTTCTAVGA
jgi:hypothetical protein